MLSMKLTGMPELRAQLAELKLTVNRALPMALRAAFRPVLEAAQAMVPVRTGDLKRSMRLAVIKGRGDEPMRVGIRFAANKQMRMAKAVFGGGDVLPGARRWHWIELGTANSSAQPFLRPALDATASAVIENLKGEIAKALVKLKNSGRR